jgi:MFS transporter, NNP family, nitrate/nitrite transporter
MNRNIKEWEVENEGFWKSTGKAIANRNLWLSIPALFLSFATWAMWGVIVKYMKDFGYNFGMTEGLTPGSDAFNGALAEVNKLYYTLPAIAGLTGATLRLPSSFLISACGGRNVIFITTALMLIPAIGTGIALSDINSSYLFFASMAFFSGFGGGNFASSMSNISGFFPKRMQGYALGMNAGIGNLGVGAMQKIIPFVVGFGIFGAFGVEAGGDIPFSGIQNAGWVWVPLLILATIGAYFGMNNISSNCPSLPSTKEGVSKSLYLVALGLVAAAVGTFMLIGLPWKDWGIENMKIWIVVPVVAFVTVQLMKYATPGELKANLKSQFKILSSKHNWIMTIIYVMTFGSFIGFSFAFPKLCQDIFEFTDRANPEFKNPNAPNYMIWAFIGPVLGALVRPLGGILSDKWNSGAKVTAVSTIVQIIATFSVASFVLAAKNSSTPEQYWWPFFASFMLLFITTGISNGSTFRSIPYIFSKAETGPVLGWTSAIAAYGAFLIPNIFGQQIAAGTPQNALYGFGAFYIFCLLLNWWYYQGPKREFDNP